MGYPKKNSPRLFIILFCAFLFLLGMFFPIQKRIGHGYTEGPFVPYIPIKVSTKVDLLKSFSEPGMINFFKALKCLFLKKDPEILSKIKKIEDGHEREFCVQELVKNHYSELANPIGLSSEYYIGTIRNEVDDAVAFFDSLLIPFSLIDGATYEIKMRFKFCAAFTRWVKHGKIRFDRIYMK